MSVTLSDHERLQLIVNVSRKATLNTFRADSCIASTRILMEVLRYFGHTSEPLPVSVVAFNREGFERFSNGEPVQDWPSPAWSIGVAGTGVSENKRWDGHLVAVVDGRWLVDPSLDQVSRPARQIELHAVVLDIEGWTDRSRPNSWVDEDTGVALIYTEMSNAGSWRESPDWRSRQAEVREAVGNSIRILKPTLAALDRDGSGDDVG